MILGRHFVYVHLPKTGGMFVRKVLAEHAPASWELEFVPMHPKVSDIPASHRHLPRLAFVRNPFAWYVSWYGFLMRNEDRDPLFEEVSAGRTLDFATTLRNLFAHERVRRGGEGPFTLMVREWLGPGLEGVEVGRVESLREDLVRLLAAHVEVPGPLARAIADTAPVNRSGHRDWRECYDDGLRALVAEGDRAALEHFGY